MSEYNYYTTELPKPPVQLRDGTVVSDPRLDRLVQFDEKSRGFRAVEGIEDRPFRSYSWFTPEFLDQGSEGACVGFCYTHDLLARPVRVKDLDASFARSSIYWEAQKIDPWPGGAYPGAEGEFYEGTSMLAGAQVLKNLGFIEEYRWAFGLDDVRRTLAYRGPVALGLNWYTGMFNPDSEGYLRPTGRLAGGHAILAKSINEKKQRVVLHNSWGRNWGLNGTAYISFSDLDKLLNEDGEACILLGRKLTAPTESGKVFAGRNGVFHDSHAGIDPVKEYNTTAEALADGNRPCGVCRPK